MPKIIKILWIIIAILAVTIGVLCYIHSYSAFYNYLVFAVPMILLRCAHAYFMCLPDRTNY